MFLSCTSQILLTFPILPSIMNQIRLKFTRCLTFESQERYNYQIYNSYLHLMKDIIKIYSMVRKDKINSYKSDKPEQDHQKSCLKYDINVAKMLKSIIANNDQLSNGFFATKKNHVTLYVVIVALFFQPIYVSSLNLFCYISSKRDYKYL